MKQPFPFSNFKPEKMEASPKRPSNAPAPVSSGELGTRHTLRRPGRLDNVGQRPTEAAESRRPTPPVSSLPPCFPNSKGLYQDHQVISIPKFAKAGKCDQIYSKVSTKTYSVIHCGLSGEPCNKYKAPSSLVCQSQCFRLTSAYSAALDVSVGVYVCVHDCMTSSFAMFRHFWTKKWSKGGIKVIPLGQMSIHCRFRHPPHMLPAYHGRETCTAA